ncbi:Sulfoacetaldehyde reductase [BD1-7 clade bacterium]|uniref:Sulfoacetaldehyde reductase n=1 Tax=BD1-7 clade bacterium TaxID=2029982 RepID=A0A5S9QI22_9GAMM|nr:Sulfoacetaldehyde reductase [BD1-7 clade bacterium]CAA0117356.1 Sulfoacetaldehyde reductase [BD1-7 clade bacterium]
MKTALITGASSGFGEATARIFARHGYRLILVARRLDRLKVLAETLDTPCHVEALDMMDTSAIDAFVNGLPTEWSTIDILVNNAGLALGTSPAQEADLTDWHTMINTNITGLVTLTHKILPIMVKQNSGSIINVGSIAGNWPYPGGNVYCGTKAFVHQFSKALRADLAGTGVRVSTIEPGLAETEFSIVRMHGDKQKADGLYTDAQPIVAEDIADMIFWLANVPPHLNVNNLEVMPTSQAWGPLNVVKNTDAADDA